MTPTLIFADQLVEIWHANSLDPKHVAAVMQGRIGNALIFDAPYSEQTHSGHSAGKLTADRAASFGAGEVTSERPNAKNERRYAAKRAANGDSGRRDLDYAAFTKDDVDATVNLWQPLCSGWCVSITDHVLAPMWGAAFEAKGMYEFAPLPLVETGSRVRMVGDGPSNWTCWIVPARPRNEEFAHWGTLPGAYIQPGERSNKKRGGKKRVMGGKPLLTMCGLVRDYSREGDLIIDPFCGGGTTIQAAKKLGRRAIGIDKTLESCLMSAEILKEERQQAVLSWGT